MPVIQPWLSNLCLKVSDLEEIVRRVCFRHVTTRLDLAKAKDI